jgi:hypothetical protein
MVTAGVVLIGVVLRAIPTIAAGFPVNDGGLFAAFSSDIVQAGFRLPHATTYNGLDIPFAYPPLAFFVAAIAHAITGLSFVELLRWIPLITTIGSLPVAALIIRNLTASDRRYLLAFGAFAVIPRSYIWLVGGGGLTRSLGFLLALGAIYVAIRVFRGDTNRAWLALGGLLGLSVLAHPQAGPFAVGSMVVLFAFITPKGGRTVVLFAMVRACAVATIVVVPWLLHVWVNYGLGPLLSAAQTGGSPLDGLVTLASVQFSGGPLYVLSGLTLFGIFIALVNRIWIIPVWLAVIVVSDPRAGLTYATLPASLAIALAVDDLGRLATRWGSRRRARRAFSVVGLCALLALGTLDGAIVMASSGTPTAGLSDDTRAAMDWARNNTDPSARFLIVSGLPWHLDSASEWFPYLADRQSVATVQGHEWIGGNDFRRIESQHAWLQRCAFERRSDCIAQWQRVVGPVDYIVLSDRGSPADSESCCLAMIRTSDLSDAEVVFRRKSVVMLAAH